MISKPKIVVVVGPTASGKSDLAVMLAKKWGGEVISADSRQVYCGMDIGTGKITKKEMRGIPHHLLNIASPKSVYTVADYKHDATYVLEDVCRRGKLPIICGGTGFYISALVDNLILPDVPPNIVLRKRLAKKSVRELFTMLKKLDPKRASVIDAKNPRRLVRAIEIAMKLGKVPALKRKSHYDTLFVGIDVPFEKLRGRIHTRLFKRMKTGMVTEAKQLHQKGIPWKRMEDLGLEYRYLARYLQKKITKKEMLAQLEREIVHYAKRQMTWFKKDKQIHWVTQNDVRSVKKLVADFLENSAASASR